MGRKLRKSSFYSAILLEKNSSAYKRKKNNFTLLEVIIAITLVALAAPILFSFPFRLAKQQVDLLFETELQRIADIEWNKLQTKLFAEEISWREILRAEGSSLLIEEQKCTLSLGKELKREFLLKKEIVEVKTKKPSADKEAKLLKVRFCFYQGPKKKKDDLSFVYNITVQGPSTS